MGPWTSHGMVSWPLGLHITSIAGFCTCQVPLPPYGKLLSSSLHDDLSVIQPAYPDPPCQTPVGSFMHFTDARQFSRDRFCKKDDFHCSPTNIVPLIRSVPDGFDPRGATVLWPPPVPLELTIEHVSSHGNIPHPLL
ncbi:hypothetical protein QBC34DRAFT_199816 [Podospora aff. communis PSN243]|uniref:Uncharacterized protein n=1 Tax=Podospora aff. communis PSN243 TaxID=3040156 RepID=A0AAV9G6I2_9PEZI|nr:hypothetical protein QBC34DRAFT_199816 [Podospora aff. communis PSN243]